MLPTILLLSLAVLAPPAVAIFFGIRMVRKNERPFQFGLIDLLVVPFLLLPASLAAVLWDGPIAFVAGGYQVAFAFLFWSTTDRLAGKTIRALIVGLIIGTVIFVLTVLPLLLVAWSLFPVPK